ncbi:DUF1653 domain-containing protein [Patescibacteria group bacterium]
MATHSETYEKFVVYENVKDDRTDRDYVPGSKFIRPFDMFIETVEWEGKQVPRFELIK